MPYRRNVRRRLRRPLRRLRRRMRIRRPLRKSLNTYHFKRTIAGTPLTCNTTAQFGSYSFQFSQLTNATEFSNLFDMYRINKIVIKFVPNHNSSEVGATKFIPNFHSVLDFNDGFAPTALTQLYEYQSWRMTRGYASHTRAFIPAVLYATQDGTLPGSGSPASMKLKQWVSTSETDVYFYGLKWGIEAANAAADVSWTPFITYYYSCKSVK